MKKHNHLILIVLSILFIGCNSTPKSAEALFSIEIVNPKKAYTTNDNLQISVKPLANSPVDEVTFSFNNKPQNSNGKSLTISLANEIKLGSKNITASIVSDGETYSLSKNIILVSTITPEVYTYTILETYPHDIKAYTQGLEFLNDTLYESTGQYGSSSLRKTDYTSGSVLIEKKLGNQFFGEGITILNDKVYQLTWREKTGFIYNSSTLEKTGSFVYGQSKEGWGLCNNGNTIFKSDGTQKIWSLNATTLAEEDFIEIYTNTSKIKSVNELEWVEGKIYANIYQKDAIAIVEPNSGAVEGVINLKGLKDKVAQHPKLDVLNGIAYKGEKDILYITGKNWDKLFKIRVHK